MCTPDYCDGLAYHSTVGNGVDDAITREIWDSLSIEDQLTLEASEDNGGSWYSFSLDEPVNVEAMDETTEYGETIHVY